jgi:iron(II)-dependent oxidoreductase
MTAAAPSDATASQPLDTPRALTQALADARQHTLALLDALAAGLPPSMDVRYLPALNPPLWLLGQLAWREDWWLSRNPLRLRGGAASARAPRSPAPLPRLDACFAPALTHAQRWHQPLPDLATTRALLAASRQRTLALLRTLPAASPGWALVRSMLWHEDRLRETLLALAQNLGVLPGPLAAAPLPCPAHEDALQVPAGLHALGTATQAWHPATDSPACTADLPAFEIDRAPVTWGRYLPFVTAGGYDEPRWWTPEGWAWRRRHGSARPRHLGQGEDGGWQLAQYGRGVPLDPRWPALHLSRHEAQAWCRWAGRRLPSEQEWEAALHHAQATTTASPFALGQVLEWTASPFPTEACTDACPEQADAPADGPPACLRGHSQATAPRLASPWARHAASPDRCDLFTGFRSCALGPADAEPAPADTTSATETAAASGADPRPARQRAAARRKAPASAQN